MKFHKKNVHLNVPFGTKQITEIFSIFIAVTMFTLGGCVSYGIWPFGAITAKFWKVTFCFIKRLQCLPFSFYWFINSSWLYQKCDEIDFITRFESNRGVHLTVNFSILHFFFLLDFCSTHSPLPHTLSFLTSKCLIGFTLVEKLKYVLWVI